MSSSKSKVVLGSQYSDSLILGANIKKANALDGDDTISINDYFLGLRVYGGNGDDTIDNQAKRSDLKQKNGPYLYGEAGNDRIVDDYGSSALISGGEGDDRIYYYAYFSQYEKPNFFVDGGPGNDVISYFYGPGDKGEVHGGDGDDLIGIWPNRLSEKEGAQTKGIAFFGDGGDDTFFIRAIPFDPVTNFYGGDGYDKFYISYAFENNIVGATQFEGGFELTFAYWQVNGVTQETKMVFFGFEEYWISNSSDVVPYQWGNDLWGDVQGEAWFNGFGF